MSEETKIQQQEPDTPTQSYISRVRLKGYKSIIDTEVTFKPGLNIIIGANGSGKTNFVEFLKIVNNSLEKIDEFYYKVELISNNNDFIEWEFDKEASIKESAILYIPVYNVSIKNKINNEIIFSENYNSEEDKSLDSVFFVDRLTKEKVGYIEDEEITFIKFNIPDEYSKLTLPLELNYEANSKIPGFFVNPAPSKNSFLEFVVNSFFSVLHELKDKFIEENEALIKEDVNKRLSLFTYTIEFNLRKFSPIKKIRIDPKFRVLIESNRVSVDNINIQFYVNDNWFSWNNLSDGTKRIFYVITESILCKKLLLLEEPELGIHPHQLSRLMDFLKEQSEEKQIILTTHSPQVLNILDTDELDRIIVANYDKEKGTLLHHLTEEEMEHARSYMETEGLFLSDYWVYSGFEKEEEEV